MTEAERIVYFHTRYDSPAEGCWEWRFRRRGRYQKYGTFCGLPAHRVAWELANNTDIPAGLIVRHRCDNKRCVRPDHLELGTHADNSRDRVERKATQPKDIAPVSIVYFASKKQLKEIRRFAKSRRRSLSRYLLECALAAMHEEKAAARAAAPAVAVIQ